MDALHGRDHAQLAETGDIGGAQVLGVLDAPAEILLIGMGLERRFENVQGFAVGAVADGMHTELKAVLYGEFGGPADIRGVVRI